MENLEKQNSVKSQKYDRSIVKAFSVGIRGVAADAA